MQISKSLEELEDVYYQFACRVLGFEEGEHTHIRFPYTSTIQSGSDPDFERTEDVCFIYVLPVEDEYGLHAHLSFRDDGDEKLTLVDEHTDVYQVRFVCYGPQAFDWVRALKAGMVRQESREAFARDSLFYVSGSGRIAPARELVNGQWWNRYDLTTTYYEFVRLEEANSVGTMEEVRITPVSERST